jgi:DNA polymerase III gamma/tau subunit
VAKKNYQKTKAEREQHNTAVKVRKMTDEQLCEFLTEIQRQSAVETAERIWNDVVMLTVNVKTNTASHALKEIEKVIGELKNENE